MKVGEMKLKEEIAALKARNAELEAALKEIIADCNGLARVEGISKGEHRAWIAIRNKTRAALANEKDKANG